MAIHLVTGTPGAGKTLRAIWLALTKYKTEGRPVFHIDIDGMDPDQIPAFPHSIQDWKKAPPGSVLLVDEAHKLFPVRQPGAPPEWIRDLTEIRHFGIELILITQDPRNIDAFVRRLVGEHQHLTRKAGFPGAMVRIFQGVSENPDDFTNRQSSTQSPWRYPKHLYSVYKSATLHVVKPKLPWKVAGAIALFLLCVVGLPLLIWSFWSGVEELDDRPGAAEASSVPHRDGAQPHKGSFVDQRGTRWETPEDYLKDHTPVVQGLPWTAPIFQDLPITTEPDLFCVVWDDGGSTEKCTCYNEQVIKLHDVPEIVCQGFARGGVYNPYRPRRAAEGASVDAPPRPSFHTSPSP